MPDLDLPSTCIPLEGCNVQEHTAYLAQRPIADSHSKAYDEDSTSYQGIYIPEAEASLDVARDH
jgi:hypothetical protein